MARALRIEYPGAWYHVTCRGNERAGIFQDNIDRSLFIKSLGESIEALNVELPSYVLMSNHFHLLVKRWMEIWAGSCSVLIRPI